MTIDVDGNGTKGFALSVKVEHTSQQQRKRYNLWGRVMNKNFIRITDNKGVEHTFYNFTSLVEYIDSFTMSFLPDDFTYFIQEENDDR